MCKCLSIKIILLFLFSLPAWSQTEDHSWEAYVQASHANTNLLLNTSTSGLRLGAAWKPSSPFGLVADLGLHRGSQEGRRGNYTTLMAGLRMSSSERGYASAFIQGRGGAYRTSGHALSPEEMGWGYILSGGGGVDIRV